jgi:MFS family permease
MHVMTYLQLFIVLSLPVTGLCYATLGAIKLPLSKRIGLDEAKVGGLISAFGLMVGPVIILCGALSDTYGRKPVWMVGSLLVWVSFLIFANAKKYVAAVVATVMLAVGWTAMINVANPVMARAFADPFTGTNLGDALFGAGAFLCPLLIGVLYAKLGFQKALTCIAMLALVPFALAFRQDLGGGQLDGELGQAFAGYSELLNDRTIWLLGLTMMCWVVIESGTAGWATTLVRQAAPEKEPEDISERIAARALSGFWLCFMAARLLAAWIIHSAEMSKGELVHITQVLQVSIAILAVLTMLGLVVFKSRRAVVGTVIFAGFICGPFFPNVIGQLFTHLEAEEQLAFGGRSVGMIFACASVGWTLLPIAMGFIAVKKDLRRAFLLPAAVGVVMTVLILMNEISVPK